MQKVYQLKKQYAVADPGFPVGGRRPRRGDVDPRGGYVTKILYVKMKESGPVVGGVRRARPPLNPPMICVQCNSISVILS